MRLWEVWYRESEELQTFPVPYDIVLEQQDSPSYRLMGPGRPLDHTQICCTISGEGRFLFRDKMYRMTPGKTFMCQLGDPDTGYWYPEDGSEPWVFLWVSFDGMTAVNMIRELNQRYGYVFTLPLDRDFILYLKQFQSMKGTTQYVSPEAGALLVMNLLNRLSETLDKNTEISRSRYLVRETCKYIESSPSRELDIRAIAEKLHVSREHLTRLFREETGITPGAYALENRMKLARRLIRDGLLTCSEIAMRTGYSSAGSFARAFKSIHHGIGPAEYRNRKGNVQYD